MKVELKVNDKSVQAEISEEQLKELGLFEQLKKLGLIENQPTGYERVKKDSIYFFKNSVGDIQGVTDDKCVLDQEYYDSGNYYSSKMIARNNARADRLLRQLRQWQALNDKSISVEDWEDNDKDKWCIMYGYGAEELYVNWFYSVRLHNVIYFTTKEKAEEAIEVFKDELLWYFTEYVQRLDEVQNV